MLAAVLVVAALAGATGCSALPGGAPSGPAYQVSAEFTEVLDLVPQAAVKVNDVTVGSVEKITLSGWNARVRMKIDRDVQLPANATAAIRQSSLLGEKFVELGPPTGQTATGRLTNGAVIPVARTSRTAEVEEVLGALGLLLNGGGLAQLKTINEELTDALSGREATVKDLLGQLNTFLGGLDAQRADITRAITALDSFSAQLARQKATIGAAVDALDPGLTVLAQQKAQITNALTSLGKLSTVGTRVVDDSRDGTLASLKSLQPILAQLVRAGDDLPKALNFLLVYPFPPNVTGAISGDFVNLHATVDLDGASILSNLLTVAPTESDEPGGSTGPGAVSPSGTSPLPGRPGAPAPSGSPTPGPSPSGSPGPRGGGGCGLLGILLGCGS
ncbi:MCE family protein [Rugosimonospora acidiphila]|uniref:MCE family protein n=1 Tax=Rugosimonospora acidiphila TaxID=556531 RepID=A0ABP9SMC2_9ACTN